MNLDKTLRTILSSPFKVSTYIGSSLILALVLFFYITKSNIINNEETLLMVIVALGCFLLISFIILLIAAYLERDSKNTLTNNEHKVSAKKSIEDSKIRQNSDKNTVESSEGKIKNTDIRQENSNSSEKKK